MGDCSPAAVVGGGCGACGGGGGVAALAGGAGVTSRFMRKYV